jgi:hypothetical protein
MNTAKGLRSMKTLQIIKAKRNRLDAEEAAEKARKECDRDSLRQALIPLLNIVKDAQDLPIRKEFAGQQSMPRLRDFFFGGSDEPFKRFLVEDIGKAPISSFTLGDPLRSERNSNWEWSFPCYILGLEAVFASDCHRIIEYNVTLPRNIWGDRRVEGGRCGSVQAEDDLCEAIARITE